MLTYNLPAKPEENKREKITSRRRRRRRRRPSDRRVWLDNDVRYYTFSRGRSYYDQRRPPLRWLIDRISDFWIFFSQRPTDRFSNALIFIHTRIHRYFSLFNIVKRIVFFFLYIYILTHLNHN